MATFVFGRMKHSEYHQIFPLFLFLGVITTLQIKKIKIIKFFYFENSRAQFQIQNNFLKLFVK